MNNTIKKLLGGDFEVMAEDNVFIELAIKHKNEALEQYKRELVEWLNTEKEKAAKEWDSHADAGRGHYESIWRSKYRQIETIIHHIEADNEKVE